MQLSVKLNIIFVFFIFIFLSACEIINPEEKIPSYIKIDSIKLDIPSSNESELSRITDAWIYVDDQIIGGFELPALFPVLVEGNHKLMIKAGIKVNGISETRGAYPFFNNFIIQNHNFIKDSVVEVKPVIKYYDETIFELNEDFESAGVLFEKTSRSDTSLEKTNISGQVFDGNYSGIVHLNATTPIFECKSIEALKLPTNGKPIFLEIIYKNDIKFTVGFFANYFQNSEQHSVFVLNESYEWNKIYINLADAINRYPNANDFNIFIGTTMPEGINDATLQFDNIRIVHM